MTAAYLIALTPSVLLARHPCDRLHRTLPPACSEQVPTVGFSGETVEEQDLDPKSVDKYFDPQHRLAKVWGAGPSRDLVSKLLKLTTRDYAASEYGADECWETSFGDILQAFCQTRHGEQASHERWTTLRKQHPKIYDGVYPVLSELLNDSGFRKKGPGGTSDRADDGFFFGASIRHNGRVYTQGATLMFACESGLDPCSAITRFKKIERSLDLYPQWKGLVDPYNSVSVVGDRV
ncbi:MAG: hypothetical protein WBE26_07035, partial [Phycisphaerae bacterium]